MNMAKLAIIRIRGPLRVSPAVRRTFEQLKLRKKFNCVILEDTPANKGMLQVVSGYITWGEISDDALKLLEKRKTPVCYTLHPPRGGFERKGTKVAFNVGGALGYRGDKINALLERMAA